jgi:hypothetical protein
LNRELGHERIDIVGAISQSIDRFERNGICSHRLKNRRIYHTFILIELNADILLALIEIEEGGGEIELGNAEAADIVIDAGKHETAIGGLNKDSFIAV